jgi:hypothetical protein
MRPIHPLTLAFAAVAALATPLAAQSVFDNFNSYTSLTDLDVNWNRTNGAGLVAIASSGGISDSRSITVTSANSDISLVNKTTSFNFVTLPGSGYTLSAFFQRGTGGTGQANPHVAFVGDALNSVNAPSTWGLGVRVNGSDQIQFYNNGGATGATVGVSLTSGNWYQISLNITEGAGNDFNLSASVFNASSSGVVGSLVASHSIVITNAAAAADTTGFAGFRLTGNIPPSILARNFDNFSAIPEPSTYAALAGAVALGLVALRRRRS